MTTQKNKLVTLDFCKKICDISNQGVKINPEIFDFLLKNKIKDPSDPINLWSYSQVWVSDHDPGNSEDVAYGTLFLADVVLNTTNNKLFMCLNPTYGAQIWAQHPLIMTRDYTDRLAPQFGTPYTPSTNTDTEVVLTLAQNSTAITPAIALIQVNTSGSWVTIGQISPGSIDLSGVVSTQTFTVPLGSQYQIVSYAGSNSIVSIYELQR